MDPICQQEGCYMFRPNSPERAECEKNCRLSSSSCKSVREAPRKEGPSPAMHGRTKKL
jgi:hypothetical protein